MKKITLTVPAAALLMICLCVCACAESTGAVLVPQDEWKWEPGAYNTFDGEIDLSEYSGQEVAVCMETDLEYDAETEKDSMPVFTVLNGSRIKMKDQSDTVRCTPAGDSPATTFSGSMKLPEKIHVNRIGFTFRVTDGNGTELKTVKGSIGENDDEADSAGAFYIPLNVSTITLIIAAAAALVWTAVLIRSRRAHKS